MERPDIPPDLDMVVLRALAKNPDDRFQTAEEMDAELERVSRGVGVTTQTADAATAVLSGTRALDRPHRDRPAPQAAGRHAAGLPVRGAPPRRRPFWPWLLALLLVVLAGVAGWYAFGQIQDALSGGSTASVPFVVGQREDQAVPNVLEQGLQVEVHREPHETVKIGVVFEQSPDGGVRVDKGGVVDIRVSLGPPRVEVPSLVGKSRDEAIALLTEAELKAKPREVFSREEPGTVIAQHPWRARCQGTNVQINVSKGVQPLTVPNVVGQQYDSAAGQLQDRASLSRGETSTRASRWTRSSTSSRRAEARSLGEARSRSSSRRAPGVDDPGRDEPGRGFRHRDARAVGFTVDVQEQDTTDPFQDGVVLARPAWRHARSQGRR